MGKIYCGIDIHKDSFVGCIIDEGGVPVRLHEFPPTKEGVKKFIYDIDPLDVSIAIEACGIWKAAYRILKEMGYTVKLANPAKTKQIACKKKTDKVDAQILADLLRTNYLPEVYIPDEETLRLRDLGRHKASITRSKNRIQAQIKAHLLQAGIKYSKAIWSKKKLKELEKIGSEEINDLIETYRFFEKREKKIMKRVEKIVDENRLMKILKTHPGIGSFGALMIVAEIGDANRFQYNKQLISYAGHAPGIYQSGKVSFTVRNSAVNKWLKWIISVCSGRAAMFDPTYKSLFKKSEKRKGFKIARRVIARKMLRTVFFMLRNEEEYHAS